MSVFEDAIESFGEFNQILKSIEELSELQRALCRYLITGYEDPNIAEELADTWIMMSQLFEIFDYKKVMEWEELKIKRLQEIIKQRKD